MTSRACWARLAGKEKELSLRTHGLSFGVVLNEISQGFTERGAAGFTGEEDFPATGFEVFCEGLDLVDFPHPSPPSKLMKYPFTG
jgi:hypothetical protein